MRYKTGLYAWGRGEADADAEGTVIHCRGIRGEEVIYSSYDLECLVLCDWILTVRDETVSR